MSFRIQYDNHILVLLKSNRSLKEIKIKFLSSNALATINRCISNFLSLITLPPCTARYNCSLLLGTRISAKVLPKPGH